MSPLAYKKVELEVFDGRGGLDGCVTVFASLAKKNFDSGVAFCVWTLEPTSDTAGLNDTVGRLGASLSIPVMFDPPLYAGMTRASFGEE